MSIPTRMRAIRVHPPGGLEGLRVDEVETPRPRPGEALVQVHAAAITRDELDWPVDRLPATPSYELSGVVVDIAPDVEGFTTGAGVYALTGFDRDGVAADYAAVRASELAQKPQTLDHVQCAAVPLAGLSAWQGLFDHGRLQQGERVLIHGAAGGVGHLATQLARHAGAHVIGTTSTANVDAVSSLGAHEVLDYGHVRFDRALEPVDLVFDTSGGEALTRSPAVLRKGGRLVSVAEEPPAVPGELGIDTVYFVVEPNREQLAKLAGLADAGDLRPTVDSVFALLDALAAFERSMAFGKRGKVVLRVAGD